MWFLFQFFASKKEDNVPKSYYIYGGVGKFRESVFVS